MCGLIARQVRVVHKDRYVKWLQQADEPPRDLATAEQADGAAGQPPPDKQLSRVVPGAPILQGSIKQIRPAQNGQY